MNNIDRILHSNRAGRQQGDRGEEVSVSHTLTGREFGGSDKVQDFMTDGGRGTSSIVIFASVSFTPNFPEP